MLGRCSDHTPVGQHIGGSNTSTVALDASFLIIVYRRTTIYLAVPILRGDTTLARSRCCRDLEAPAGAQPGVVDCRASACSRKISE